MKSILITTILSAVIALSSCTNNKPQKDSATQTDTSSTEKLAYTCPMHPAVISDQPGKCPECKMNLVEKTASQTDTAGHQGHNH